MTDKSSTSTSKSTAPQSTNPSSGGQSSAGASAPYWKQYTSGYRPASRLLESNPPETRVAALTSVLEDETRRFKAIPCPFGCTTDLCAHKTLNFSGKK
nr:uncharacterized protein CI109_005326 [Kwoniella shandongensis]KAA5526369.1 hypothetical protein CI109_005326 [Kwoniella shandongensis]